MRRRQAVARQQCAVHCTRRLFLAGEQPKADLPADRLAQRHLPELQGGCWGCRAPQPLGLLSQGLGQHLNLQRAVGQNAQEAGNLKKALKGCGGRGTAAASVRLVLTNDA